MQHLISLSSLRFLFSFPLNYVSINDSNNYHVNRVCVSPQYNVLSKNSNLRKNIKNNENTHQSRFAAVAFSYSLFATLMPSVHNRV